MAFFQAPPALGNQFDDDAFLQAYLARRVPKDVWADVAAQLRQVGALAGGELYRDLLEQHRAEPTLTSWDAWGKRIDRIDVTPLWHKAQRLAAEKGLVATAYEKKYGAASRLVQFALVYLLDPSTGVYACPLAMTDGAAKTLSVSGNKQLIEHAVPRLTSRDPAQAWTSGQWMTERTGGSDVAISETSARADGDAFRLYGTKWFTSATTSQMALTLARPEGAGAGGKGLALFYLETRLSDGSMNGIMVNRLKDKLGTRMVPTAELTLDGARAVPVVGLSDGIRNITPMLSVTRTWNAIAAVGGMRRGMALSLDYAKKRVAFGAPLAEKPLHAGTLSQVRAETLGAFVLAFRAAELLGREECGEITEDEAALLRMLTPLAKLCTGKQAVAVASEVLESFGGAGYVEDTGLPRLLRDAQVLPIWEGTTNVLSLDVIRALARGTENPLGPIETELSRCTERAHGTALADAARTAQLAFVHARSWLGTAVSQGPAAVEAGARRFSLTLARALSLGLLVDEAMAQAEAPTVGAMLQAAARRYALSGVDCIEDESLSAEFAALLG
jgi:alkylation response protein AidB-like acyl-CoA dehydrogenase